jgi:hypothetical protein
LRHRIGHECTLVATLRDIAGVAETLHEYGQRARDGLAPAHLATRMIAQRKAPVLGQRAQAPDVLWKLSHPSVRAAAAGSMNTRRVRISQDLCHLAQDLPAKHPV